MEAGAARSSVANVADYEDRTLALLAAQIGGVEAQHWAVLLAAAGANPVPSPIIELDGTADMAAAWANRHTGYPTDSMMPAATGDEHPADMEMKS